MQLVEPAVPAQVIVHVAAALAVVAQRPGLLGQGVVVGQQGAAVADAPEVLGRIEAERRGGSGRADRQAVVRGADGLRGVLDDRDAESLREGPQAAQGEGAAVEVDGQHEGDARPARERLLGAVEVEQAVPVHVDETRDGAHLQHGQRGGEGGKRRGQHLGSRPAAGRAQGNGDGVETVADADRMADATGLGELRFERRDGRAEDVVARGSDGFQRGGHVWPDLRPLANEVVEQDHATAR